MPLVIVALAALLIFLFRKKRKALKNGAQVYHDSPTSEVDRGFTVFPRQELPTVERQEMGVEEVRHETGVGLPHELLVPHVVHELAGSEHRSR